MRVFGHTFVEITIVKNLLYYVAAVRLIMANLILISIPDMNIAYL